MSNVDDLVIHFEGDELYLMNIALMILMFGIALDLKLQHFKAIVQMPKSIAVGLSSQWILLPLLTIGLILLTDLPESMVLGLLLVAACPGGNVSNFAVHIAGGNSALSISLTTISTIFAVIGTPLIFQILAPLFVDSEVSGINFYIPLDQMALTIGQLIVLPLAIGMGLNHFFPHLASKMTQPIRILSMILFLVIVVVAILGNLENLFQYAHLAFFLVVIHNAMAILGGYSWATLWRLPTKDRRAIAIETGIQNSGLGLILIFNFFDGLGGMALVAASWGIWHLIAGGTLAAFWNQRPISD